MAFQIKDFVSIVAAQVNHARAVTDKITDFVPGSVARTLMEAPAVEIEELYMRMFLGLRDAIPVATYLSFGFDKMPAAVAHGWVRISTEPAPAEDSVIPAGTVFTAADGRLYASTQDVAWKAGENVARIPVAYSQAGSVGNIAAGVITTSPSFGSGYVISNSAIETGRDTEGDDERIARFASYIASLSRGTVEACRYAAKSASVLDDDGNLYEYVTRLGLAETPGRVMIYIHSNRGTASEQLLASGQRMIDGYRDETTGAITPGYRAAGIRVDVLRMIEKAVTMTVQVGMFPGYELNDDVRRRLDDVFSAAARSVEPGGLLYVGKLTELMLAVPGVRQVVPIGAENLVCAMNEALVPGVLQIGAL